MTSYFEKTMAALQGPPEPTPSLGSLEDELDALQSPPEAPDTGAWYPPDAQSLLPPPPAPAALLAAPAAEEPVFVVVPDTLPENLRMLLEPDLAPVPEPEPTYPGDPKEYEIIVYRDSTFRIVEERIHVTSTNHISPAIALERARGRAGVLIRFHKGNQFEEIEHWT